MDQIGQDGSVMVQSQSMGPMGPNHQDDYPINFQGTVVQPSETVIIRARETQKQEE